MKSIALALALLCGPVWAQDMTTTGVGGFLSNISTPVITLVQHTPGTANGDSNATSWSTTLNGTTAGNLLIVSVFSCVAGNCGVGTAQTVSSVTSNQPGETCAQATGAAISNTTYFLDVWYCKNIHGGNDTITANFSGTAGHFANVALSEWNGASTTAPLDAPTVANNTSGGATSITGTTAASTVQTNEIVYATAVAIGQSSISSNQTNINSGIDAYQQAATTQTYSNTFSWSGSHAAGIAIAAFKHP